jgi:phenylalanyl-tRNA synthetase beta chain
MLVSLRWLRELCPALDASPDDIAQRLNACGLAVEGVTHFGAASEQVVVAVVRRVDAHPKKDKLSLVTVDGGQGEQTVVCGASNVPPPGGLVVLAPLGAHLPAAGLTIAPRAIAGVESAGMLCSESELGLAESSEGILILAPGTGPVGARLSDAIPSTSDVVFDISVTPNRPDALGHLGVARDLAAVYGLPFASPAAGTPAAVANLALNAMVTVHVQDGERCPLYAAGVVDDVTVAPSPDWVRHRLASVGVRSISNVVDVTNLLLLEFGQPLHAFDQAFLTGKETGKDAGKDADSDGPKEINVRLALPDEAFTTLDGVARKLDADDLVICDAERPVALAGVMGGKDSEIKATTRRVLLEAAYFHPRSIRRTARRHGLNTDASHRFERGVDWGAVPLVLERAKVLLTELAGGKAVPGIVAVHAGELERPTMRLRSRRLDALLGVKVPFDEATAILQRLGFDVRGANDGDERLVAEVRGASHRPDCSREVDLVEEVVRIRGLDTIPTVLPAILPQTPRTAGRFERRVFQEATALGLSEAITYSFVASKDLEKLGAPRPVVVLKNPQSEERNVMRTSLLPGLLDVLRRARRRGVGDLRSFSVGTRFLPAGGPSTSPSRPRYPEDIRALPEERPSFAAVLAGKRPSYLGAGEAVDVYDAKGIGVELVTRLTGREPSVTSMTDGERLPYLHPRGAAWLSVEGTRVGAFGPLHPDTVGAFDLDGPAQVVELDLDALEALGRPTPKFRPIPRLPPNSRDVAVVVDGKLPAADVAREIRTAAGDLCDSVELFDVFSGTGVPEGSRSLAYHVVYRDPKGATDPDAARTLTDEEVDQRHEKVRQALGRLGELRA